MLINSPHLTYEQVSMVNQRLYNFGHRYLVFVSILFMKIHFNDRKTFYVKKDRGRSFKMAEE